MFYVNLSQRVKILEWSQSMCMLFMKLLLLISVIHDLQSGPRYNSTTEQPTPIQANVYADSMQLEVISILNFGSVKDATMYHTFV